jgi:hypothetical protein
MSEKININSSILDQVIANRFNKSFQPQQNQGGLLNFVKSPYAGDIGMGLLAQSGYSTMPTSFGQSLGVATNQANQLRSQRRANDLSELGTLTSLKNVFKPDYFQRDPTQDLMDRNTGEIIQEGVPAIDTRKANTQSYISTKDNTTLTLDLNSPEDQALINSPDFQKNYVEMSLQTSEKPTLISPKVKGDISNSYSSSATLIQNLTEYQNQIIDPTTLTSPTLQNFTIMVDNVKTLVDQAGGLFEGDEPVDTNSFFEKAKNSLNGIDTGIAGETGVLKSMAIQIAYDYAKQNNKDGRISEKDFEYGLKILTAGGVSNKNTLVVNAEKLKQRTIRSFKNELKGMRSVNEIPDSNKFGFDLESNLNELYESSPFFKDNTLRNTTSTQSSSQSDSGFVVIDLTSGDFDG